MVPSDSGPTHERFESSRLSPQHKSNAEKALCPTFGRHLPCPETESISYTLDDISSDTAAATASLAPQSYSTLLRMLPFPVDRSNSIGQGQGQGDVTTTHSIACSIICGFKLKAHRHDNGLQRQLRPSPVPLVCVVQSQFSTHIMQWSTELRAVCGTNYEP